MRQVSVFGINGDADNASVENLLYNNAAINLPSTAAATEIVSDSVNDASAGTGVRTVLVQGLDEDFQEISETVTMNGTTVVALTKEYYRINRLIGLTFGSGAAAAGTVTVRHVTGPVILRQIPPGDIEDKSAFFTCSAECKVWKVKRFHGICSNAVVGTQVFTLAIAPDGEAFSSKQVIAVYAPGTPFAEAKPECVFAEPGDTIKIGVSSNVDNAAVQGGFELIGSTAPMK